MLLGSLLFSSFLLTVTSSVSASHSDKNHTACTPIEQTTQYESQYPWKSDYTYDRAEHYWQPKWVWVPPYTYYIDGVKYTQPGYDEDRGRWIDNGYSFQNPSCGPNGPHDPFNPNIYTIGVVKWWNVTASGPKGTVGPVSGTVYWVKKVDIYLTWNGGSYQKDVSNGTTMTPSPITVGDGNNSGLTTYSDQDMPQVHCIKTYGDGSERACPITAVVDRGSGKRLTCYRYQDPYTADSDKVCTERVYVSNVKITSGATKTYTGKHYNYECLATFADGTTRNVSAQDTARQSYVWLSHPSDKGMTFRDGRYIGTKWVEDKGYKDPRGIFHEPYSLHDFYPVDSESRTYILNCTYYPDEKWVIQHYGTAKNRIIHKNAVISDYDLSGGSPYNLAKHDKMTVNHIGIQKMWVEVEGEFAKYNEAGKTTTYETKKLDPTTATDTFPGGWNLVDKVNNKSYAPGYWNQHYFLVGHWYDFKSMIKYNDGTDRDVTSAEEVYWDNSPWFKNMAKFNVKNIYDSGMSKTGLDHRIPEHDWNTIDVEYLHQNVPYGQTAYKRTKMTNRLKAREIKSLDITHESSKDQAPVSVIKQGENKKVQYHAWITWSDNVRENWTNHVRWDGDYLVNHTVSLSDKWASAGNGSFDFTPVKGIDQKTTVYADHKDVESLLGTATRVIDNKGTVQTSNWNSGKKNWDANHDEVEVTITDCSEIDHLGWKCPEKVDYWRTDILTRFNTTKYGKSPNSNFYPDADYYEWGAYDDDHDIYMIQRKFPVSGTSAGVGNQ